MTTNYEQDFIDKVKELLNTNKEERDLELLTHLYELSEEVIFNLQGGNHFKREFGILQNIIKTHEPFVLNDEKGIAEHAAWTYWMQIAIQEGVVLDLSEEKVEELKELTQQYDDAVDVFVDGNLGQLSEATIQQLYLAQTISFFYSFDGIEDSKDNVKEEFAKKFKLNQ